jgi:hypothetical protein
MKGTAGQGIEAPRARSHSLLLQSPKDDPNFDHKLDAVTAGGSQYLNEHLLTKITRKNGKISFELPHPSLSLHIICSEIVI